MTEFMSTLRKLQDDRTKRKFTDAILQVEDQVFHVHKLILEVANPYFSSLFTSPLTNKEGVIEIKGVSSQVFELILDSIYGLESSIKTSVLREAYLAADMFCVDDLVKFCETYFLSHWKEMDKISEAYFLAEHFKHPKVIDAIMCKMVTEYFSILSVDNAVVDLSIDLIMAAIKSHRFRHFVKNEKFLINVIWEWLSHDPDSRLQYAESLLKEIRVEAVPPSYLSNCISLLADLFSGRTDHEEVCSRFFEIVNSRLEVSRARRLALGISVRIASYGDCDVQIVDTADWTIHSFFINHKVKEIVMLDQVLYLFGVKRICKYDTTTKLLEPYLQFPNERHNYTAFFCRGYLYIAGGFEQPRSSSISSFIYQYDGARKQWLPKAGHEAGTSKLCNPSVCVVDGNIYIAGGSTNEGFYNEKCYKYNITNRTFSAMENTLSVKLPKIAVFNDTLYAFTTRTKSGRAIIEKVGTTQEKKKVLLCENEWFNYPDGCKLLEVLVMNEGILMAFRDDLEPQDVCLGLYHPSKGVLEPLGYIGRPASKKNLVLFGKNFKVFLKKLS